jgi:FkbM family methyltransferase
MLYGEGYFSTSLHKRQRGMGTIARAARLLPIYCRRFRRDLMARFPVPLLAYPEAELQITLDMVLSHYRQTHASICFMQVGAYDGVSGDPLYPLIERHGLRGYLIEPQADAFARLEANYAHFNNPDFVLVRAAVGEQDGTIPLYRIKPDHSGPAWLPQIASVDKNFLLSLSDVVPGVESLIQIEDVPCFTFTTLFHKFDIQHIDLLQIDTEGRDAEILRLFDVAHRLPAIIQFEHKHLSAETYDECLLSLIPLGYKVAIARDDTIAYRISS